MKYRHQERKLNVTSSGYKLTYRHSNGDMLKKFVSLGAGAMILNLFSVVLLTPERNHHHYGHCRINPALESIN